MRKTGAILVLQLAMAIALQAGSINKSVRRGTNHRDIPVNPVEDSFIAFQFRNIDTWDFDPDTQWVSPRPGSWTIQIDDEVDQTRAFVGTVEYAAPGFTTAFNLRFSGTFVPPQGDGMAAAGEEPLPWRANTTDSRFSIDPETKYIRYNLIALDSDDEISRYGGTNAKYVAEGTALESPVISVDWSCDSQNIDITESGDQDEICDAKLNTGYSVNLQGVGAMHTMSAQTDNGLSATKELFVVNVNLKIDEQTSEKEEESPGLTTGTGKAAEVELIVTPSSISEGSFELTGVDANVVSVYTDADCEDEYTGGYTWSSVTGIPEKLYFQGDNAGSVSLELKFTPPSGSPISDKARIKFENGIAIDTITFQSDIEDDDGDNVMKDNRKFLAEHAGEGYSIWHNVGVSFCEPEWSPSDSQNHPIAHVMDRTVQIEIAMSIPDWAQNSSYTLTGTSETDGFSFSRSGTFPVNNTTTFTTFSQDSLPRMVGTLEPTISWSVTVDGTSYSLGSSSHKVFVTLSSPLDLDAVTQDRLERCCSDASMDLEGVSRTDAARNIAQVIMDEFGQAQTPPRYTLGADSPQNPTDKWLLLEGGQVRIPGNPPTWIDDDGGTNIDESKYQGECIDLSKLQRRMCRALGVDGELHFIYASTDRQGLLKKVTNGHETLTVGGNTYKLYYHAGGGNNWEACLVVEDTIYAVYVGTKPVGNYGALYLLYMLVNHNIPGVGFEGYQYFASQGAKLKVPDWYPAPLPDWCSGHITHNGVPLSGVKVENFMVSNGERRFGEVSRSNGRYYSQRMFEAGEYRIVPKMAGYRFDPPEIRVPMQVGQNLSGAAYDFVARLAPAIAISHNNNEIDSGDWIRLPAVQNPDSSSSTIVISNDGQAELNIAGLNWNGENASEFSIVSTDNGPIPVGESREFDIEFRAPQIGENSTRVAELSIVSDDQIWAPLL